MRLSVVIPAHNEADNLQRLLRETYRILQTMADFEIVVVDDASRDATPAVLKELQQELPVLVVVRHRTNCGQSAALMTGIDAASGTIIATMDGDGQNDPGDLPGMIAKLEHSQPHDRVQMVAGIRQKRQDSWWRIISSRIANLVRSRVLGDGVPDSGCGIKVFRKSAFLRLPRFNHMHRFLPALIVRDGGRVLCIPVGHRPRLHGQSHYGTLRRLLAGLVDLAGVVWLIRRNRNPDIEYMEVADEQRADLDCIRIDRATPVHRSVRRSVA